MRPSGAIEILEYVDSSRINPFRAWFDALDSPAAARVTAAMTRLAQGNWSNARSVGNGVHELRISFGPGYRVYFGSDGPTIVVLVAGGTKVRQQQGINCAIDRWRDYRRRKRRDELKWH
jgi:putative addiction module killer protein